MGKGNKGSVSNKGAINRTVVKYKGKKPELPVNDEPSNVVADTQSKLIFAAMCLVSTLLVGGALVWSVREGVHAAYGNPANLVGVVVSVLAVAASVLLARTLIWASLFVPIMFASKSKAWASLESLCNTANKLWRIIPGGSATAAVMLVQSLMSRGQYDDAVKFADDEWQLHHENIEYNRSLAPMYSAVGMVLQSQGDFKNSLMWCDRAIEAFEGLLDQLVNKPSFLAKLANSQNQQVTAGVHTQLAVSYFNSAATHFNQRNYRAAKESYKRTLDHLNSSSDFPEKADLLMATKEQMSRLKHT